MTDAFLRKYDTGGNELWTRQFGTSATDQAAALAVDSTGVYVAGYTEGAFSGQTNLGGYDAFLCKYDPAGNELWTRQFGTSATDQAFALAVDATGVYVAGNTLGVFPGQTNAGNLDAFLRKYDSGGSELWTRQFGTPSYEYANALAADPTGVYVAGETSGILPGQAHLGGYDAFVRKYEFGCDSPWTRQFGSPDSDVAYALAADPTGVYVAGATMGTFPGQARLGGIDAFLRKYDACDNDLWTRQFGTSADEYAAGVAVDATGVYIAGWTFGALPGQTFAGDSDAFLRKYDSSGNELWTDEFGTSARELLHALGVDATGVYVAGFTTGTFPGQTSSGAADAFVRKYDASGNVLWTRQFGSSNVDVISALTVDATGVYVAGDTTGILPGQTTAGGYDAFLRKYDASGNEQWTRQFGTSGADVALALTADATGVYAAGWTSGTFPGETSVGLRDAFTRKYDPSGNVVWTREFGSTADDEVWALAADPTGVYVAGYTDGTLPLQRDAGSRDAFLRKYDPRGNELWTYQFGTSAPDETRALVLDATGLYAAGDTTGTFPLQTSAGSSDAFVGQPWIQPPALLRVTTDPAVAGKILVDGVPRDEWGLAWMKIGAGQHTVSFGGLNGLATPVAQTVVMPAGLTTAVQGAYEVNGYLRVTTATDMSGVGVPSTIYVDGVPRDDWGMWTALPPGTYTVHFGAVAGYDPPADRSATVVAGATTTVTGTFVTNPSAPGPDPSTFGYLRVTTNPATASQILLDGIPMDDWGLAWVKVPQGTYSVTFGGAYGVTPPTPQAVTVVAGMTTTYNAVFTVHGSLRVMTSPALPGTIYIDGVPRDDWGMWQSMPPGTYTVSFGKVPGYETPASKIVVVTSGVLTEVIGGYVDAMPAPQTTSPAVSGSGTAVSPMAVPRRGLSRLEA